MPVWSVCGGNELRGSAAVQGSKNAVLPILAASLLSGGETRLTNCPHLLDVDASAEILRHLGCRVMQNGGKILVDSSGMSENHIPHELMLKMRSSVMYMGAILARCGEVRLSTPGGCELGSRPIDLHLAALRALGAEVEETGGEVVCRAGHGLRGTHLNLDFPSVGATENLTMASVCAQGTTTIRNAACEPEIVDLANFLNAMGADVQGAGTPNIIVNGVKELHPAQHTTVGDRIEAGTFLVAGALSGGPVTVEGVCPDHLALALKKLQQMGCDLISTDDSITVERSSELRAVDIQTLPHPGFPTDLQAQFMVLASLASGDSIITENVFENRFMFAAELRRMGADIRIDGHHALISGVPRLSGAPVNSTDLRAGAALVLAGLVADGQTVVDSIYHIDRGYESYEEKLRGLGADVRRVPIDAVS